MPGSEVRKEGKTNPWHYPPRPLTPTRTEAIALLAVLLAAMLAALPAFLPGLIWSRAATVLPTGYRADPSNGAYLAQAAGCTYCHTAPGRGATPLAGGRRVRTPFGTLISPNITPHPEAGIGAWTERDFVAAMRFGLSPGDRHYYPAFPYTAYAGMAVTDLLDIKRYLDGVAPSEQLVRQGALTFPFSVRPGVGLWKLLHFQPHDAPATPPREGAGRGRYLTEAVAHCAECHTPRTALGGLRRTRWMAGTGAGDFAPHVPNITPHRDGIGSWTRDALIAYLATGMRPDGRPAGGAMLPVIEHMTSRLTGRDRAAMADYLLSLPPLPPE
jgi:mono/diheme cytochrome c family protein